MKKLFFKYGPELMALACITGFFQTVFLEREGGLLLIALSSFGMMAIPCSSRTVRKSYELWVMRQMFFFWIGILNILCFLE